MSRAAVIAAALAVTALTYAPVGSAAFVYEDANAITANPAVNFQAPIQIDRARALSALSHRIVWAAVGARPAAHHWTNVALHALNGGLVYGIAVVFLPASSAWLAAALFLLHPIQSEAVAYAASRSELLAATCALTAVWLSLRPQSAWRSVGVWVAVVAALSAKESAVVVIPLIAVADVFRGRRLTWGRAAALIVPAGLMAISVVALEYTSRSELRPLAYAATQATALWRYLGAVVLPVGLSVDHDFDLVPWAARWLALGSLVVVALLTALLLCTRGDETHRLDHLWDELPGGAATVFGVTWLLIAVAPRFVMRIPEMLNEHQTYLPFVGIWIAIAAVLTPLLAPAGVQSAEAL